MARRFGRRVEVALARIGYRRLLAGDLPGAVLVGLPLFVYRRCEEARGAAAFRMVMASG